MLSATAIGVSTCPYLTAKLKLREMNIIGPKSSTNYSALLKPSREEEMEKKIKYIEVKVASVEGICGLGHKPGDIVKITEQGIEGKICIHALYSLLPAAFAMLYEARFPWLTDNPDKKTHACPDAANPVLFEISRIRE